MKLVEPDRKLYLAIPEEVDQEFFSLRLIQAVIAAESVPVIAYDARKEVIVRWRD